MPWTYKINPTLKIVEVSYSGSTSARDLKESTSASIALEKEKSMNRFLIDASKMKFSASLTDLYNLSDKQYIEEEAERSGRVALILLTSPKETEAVSFYETACKNRGWNVQAFSERQEAVNWLTGDISAINPNDGDGR